MLIQKPHTKFKTFAKNADERFYLPIAFGTNNYIPKDNYSAVANSNYEFGFQSLEGDLQDRDLNSLFYYITSGISYLYQQGIPEFSAYQDYGLGAVIQFKNKLYMAKEVIYGIPEPKPIMTDACGNPCAGQVIAPEECVVGSNPQEAPDKWEEIILMSALKELEAQVEANRLAAEQCCQEAKNKADTIKTELENAINELTDSFNGKIKALTDELTSLKDEKDTLQQELNTFKEGLNNHKFVVKNEDGSYTFKNLTGDPITFKHTAEMEIVDVSGRISGGFVHKTTDM